MRQINCKTSQDYLQQALIDWLIRSLLGQYGHTAADHDHRFCWEETTLMTSFSRSWQTWATSTRERNEICRLAGFSTISQPNAKKKKNPLHVKQGYHGATSYILQRVYIASACAYNSKNH